MAQQTSLYKDTITTLNGGWADLIRLYGIGDTRVSYLRQYECILSQNCPGKMLWQFDCYKELTRIQPLPSEQRAKVSSDTFFNYLLVYEQIMREIGLIDKAPVVESKPEEEKAPIIPLYDMQTDDDVLDEFFSHAAVPGAVWLTSGFKGGGKSHTAIAVAEQMVKGHYASLGKVIVATNIIFFHKVDGEIKEECPEGVHSITTMRDLFPIIVDAIGKFGRENVTVLLILDEAQNFIGGDGNQTNASAMMKEFLGIIRKFRLMVWFLTPSAQAIGPSFRNYLNDEKYPGNLTAKWKKDLALNEQYIESQRLRYSPKELMLVKNFDKEPIYIRVPITEWTKTQDTIEEGEYCYDHEASATFYVGEGFDWEMFNRAIGGVSSNNALTRIKQFYQQNVGDVAEKKKSEDIESKDERKRRESMTLAIRMRYNEPKRSWASIAADLGVSKTTIFAWRNEFGVKDDLSDGFSQGIISTLPKKKQSSKKNGRAKKTGNSQGISISITDEEPTVAEESSEEVSEQSDDAPDVIENASPESLGVPDGVYSKDEFDRAVEYCTKETDDEFIEEGEE